MFQFFIVVRILDINQAFQQFFCYNICMPLICKDKFEKHKKGIKHDDDLHVEAISNPELAARLAALKYVKNSNLDEHMAILDMEKDLEKQYLKTILASKIQGPMVAAKHVNMALARQSLEKERWER